MKKLKTILKYNYKVLLIISIVFSLIYVNYYNPKSYYSNNDKYIKGYVKKIKGEDKLIITLKGKEKVLVYYNKKIDLKINDYILVKGNLKDVKGLNSYTMFNYRKYLKSKKIKNVYNAFDIKIIKRNKNIYYIFKNKINDSFKRYESGKYLKLFIMGNKDDFDYKTKDVFKNLGIIHLLSISGTYIAIIILVLNKLITNKYKNSIIIIFLLFYIIFTDFQISIIRCSLCYIFLLFNKKYNIGFETKEILILLMSFLLFINPFYIIDTGFLLSFVISYSLIYFKDLYKDKNGIIKCFIISFLSFLSSLPIIINMNYKVNFLSIFFNIIFVPISSFLLFPLSFLTYTFPFLDSTYFKIVNIFESISFILNEIKLFTFNFSKIPFYLIILYYVFFFLKRKEIFFLILLLYLYNIYSFTYKIYFIDVGQGDSILVRNKKINILIDTGYSYIENNNKFLYLNSVGVKKINYLILTHGDADHCGEAINLVNNFKVEKVIFNCGEYNDLEKELIKVLDKKRIKYYSCIKELNIDKNKLYFLQTKEYDNENDNSNVIYTEISGFKFMLMGDAGIEKEKDIIDKYNISDIDVLKVGHHGSKTSSSDNFINEINPKYGVISVGKNNRYGHPNKEVLNTLKQSKIYRTDEDGSIMFKMKDNKMKIETCSP